MALTESDFSYYYGLEQPAMSDIVTAIGGGVDIANPFVLSNTGMMPTGASDLAGAGSDTYYAKLFVRHEGLITDVLTNPSIYISNENVSDQVQIALDPSFTGGHVTQTGQSDNRTTLPDQLVAGDFRAYKGGDPLVINSIATGAPITMSSGESIGFWVKVSIPAGLSSAYTNTFDFVLRGDV